MPMISKTRVKYIQSLSHKKFRDADRVFVAEGPKIVSELLQQSTADVKEIYATTNWASQNESALAHFQALLTIVENHELEKISFLSTSNQVLALCSQPDFTPYPIDQKVSLVLDTIQDPGNLGTIVRTADWFGIDNIFCSADSADIFAPKVVQSTMASIIRVQVSYIDLADFVRKHQHLGVYAAALDGKSLYEFESIRHGLILIGNESKGLSPELLKLSNHRVCIPGKGKAESLNAAVAAGIILSQLVR